MAKIDTSGIENFDTMTADEKVAALLAYQYDDGSEKLKAAEADAAKWKAASDKASSEAAGYKKQLRDKLTDEERTKQETNDTLEAMKAKLAEYEQREKISSAKAVFLGGGFDEKTATDAANAFISGDIEKMSAAVKAFRESTVANAKSELLADTPRPEGGSKANTKPDYSKLYDEAVASGNMPDAAYYMRLSQQSNQ